MASGWTPHPRYGQVWRHPEGHETKESLKKYKREMKALAREIKQTNIRVYPEEQKRLYNDIKKQFDLFKDPTQRYEVPKGFFQSEVDLHRIMWDEIQSNESQYAYLEDWLASQAQYHGLDPRDRW